MPPTSSPLPRLAALGVALVALGLNAAAQTATNPPPRWLVTSESTNTHFASHLAAAGDVNADSCADVLLAEIASDPAQSRVLAYYGSRNGPPPRPNWFLAGTTNDLGAQRPVAAEGIGDLDRDGFADVVVVWQGLGPATDSASARLRDRLEIFRGGPAGLATQPAWTLTAAELSAQAIVCAGRAGDLNGDNFPDVFVLITLEAPAPTNRYAVCLLYGSAVGLRHDLAARLDLFPPAFLERPWVASAGDVNRDGCDDLLIGEPHWTERADADGRALLYHGSRQGLRTQPAWTATYPLPVEAGGDDPRQQFFGIRAAGVGDVNGDGCADVLVSAPWADHGDVNEGLVFGYYGSTNGLSRAHQWFIESESPYAGLGVSLSGAGDVNGDGFADVIIGAPRASDGQIKEGAAVVYLGSADGLARTPHWSVLSDHTEHQLGYFVAGVGDVNGDGYDDVLVAAPEYADEQDRHGCARLDYGSRAGLTGSFNWRLEKPFLTRFQQWLTRTSNPAKLGAFAALLVALAVLAVAWRRALHRALRAERELAITRERARLARNLHDQLGASLARLTTLSADTHAPTGELSAAVRQTVLAAQQAVWKTNPTHDTLEGFITALLQDVEAVFADTPVRCWTEAPENPPALALAGELREHVSLAVREACANVLKHARATEAWLRITLVESALEIVLEDNGIGLAPAPVRPGANGLKNLRERLTLLGGEARFEPRPGGGLRVILRTELTRP